MRAHERANIEAALAGLRRQGVRPRRRGRDARHQADDAGLANQGARYFECSQFGELISANAKTSASHRRPSPIASPQDDRINRSLRQWGGFHASQHHRRARAHVWSGADRLRGRAAADQARRSQRPDGAVFGSRRHGLGPRGAHGGRGFRRQGAGPADRNRVRRPPEQARHRRQHRAAVDRDRGRHADPRRAQFGGRGWPSAR